MRESDTSGGYAVLTMEYMADGTNVRRDLLEHDLDPETADSLQELVYAARRELPDAEEDRGARLRIDLAPEIRYSVSPRQRCEPAPRSAAIEQAMREYTGTGTRRRGGARTRVVLVRVTVHPAGYVAGAAILRGADRGGTLERDLERFVEQFSFEPATIDGIPTYGYIDVPIHVRY